MNEFPHISIDLSEKFPHLRNAPIVEAVIDFRARFQEPWDHDKVRQRLGSALPDYPIVDGQRGFRANIKAGDASVPTATTQDLGWSGLVVRSTDKLQVANFRPEGLVFSRLAPYADWALFSAEALRLWNLMCQILTATAVGRLGLRFINRVEVPLSGRFKDYLTVPPRGPVGFELPFAGFFHADTFAVPGHTYVVNLRRTMQSHASSVPPKTVFIVDIDVSTTHAADDQVGFQRKLDEMRWLKNKVFFGSISADLIEGYK